ncbi:TIGR03084 family protein [Haloechinothrix alba]|uniref:TIGR03084 family protein n=1 Tax=Haloechinothrix alba TaxID=664784 RepID=A0A238Z413_9PSEU|nr:TIGR03084 family metal-binding protein [Haloechinothrix alba]SNR77982.1 TIGR03084 family protein [Haloechinothrix alba]
MVQLVELLDDLDAEGADLDALVTEQPAGQWRLPTPAPGWTIAHQIAHLAWTDEVALLAATRPEEFRSELDLAANDPDGFVDRAAERGAAKGVTELLATWRTGRSRLRAALAELPEGTRLPWFGPPMKPASMATARLMETWAHGQDVADALGVVRTGTDRLRHVAHIGVRTRDFAYHAHSLQPPAEEFRVELEGPTGQQWTWGPGDARQRVTGSALEFCLVVTQRRHPDDTALAAEGDEARRWLGIAQAFAGPPGQGRKAGQFA